MKPNLGHNFCILPLFFFAVLAGTLLQAQPEINSRHIQPGARVFLEKMDGFEDYLLPRFAQSRFPLLSSRRRRSQIL